eukprot:Hpha_TRINITY_DN15222_c5_g11::TRINITY_DN15222_c5_g11_i2::g.66893::m.66893
MAERGGKGGREVLLSGVGETECCCFMFVFTGERVSRKRKEGCRKVGGREGSSPGAEGCGSGGGNGGEVDQQGANYNNKKQTGSTGKRNCHCAPFIKPPFTHKPLSRHSLPPLPFLTLSLGAGVRGGGGGGRWDGIYKTRNTHDLLQYPPAPTCPSCRSVLEKRKRKEGEQSKRKSGMGDGRGRGRRW